MKPQEASSTAKVIAAATLLLASDPATKEQVAPGAAALCQHFLATTWGNRMLAASATHPATRWLWRMLEGLTHPGITRHYWHRKRWIETHCLQALQQGVERVVIIGAGLDTLALRLANVWPAVQWVEVDHPATQQLKRAALQQANIHLPSNVVLQAVDLSTAPLPAALLHNTRPTLVVIEGVLMYLSEAAVVDLLRHQLPQQLSTAPVSLIFSHMVRWPDGTTGFRPASRWVNLWLAWRAERFTWALASAAVSPWLAQQGYTLQAQAEPPFLDTPPSAGASRLQGENLVLCQLAPRVTDVSG